jgi:transposase
MISYANLDWLAEQQADIANFLFARQGPSQGLFLYITSAYLEGQHNAFGAFGYNRDGKHGKQQIVGHASTSASALSARAA